MATDKIYSQPEILEALKQKAGATNLDSFRVRVSRKLAPHLAPTYLATFDEVRIEQLVSPELWLLEMFGGGAFEFICSHMQDPNGGLPGPLKYSFDVAQWPLKNPDYNAMVQIISQTNWMGPVKILYPRPPSASNIPGNIVTTALPPAAMAPPPVNLSTVGNPVLNNIATGASSTAERQEAMRLQQVAEQLERQERKNLKDELSLQIERATARTAPQAPTGPSMVEILTAAAPLITGFMQQKQQMEMMMFKAQQDSAALQLQMAQESAKQQMALMQMLLNKPEKDDFGQMKMVAELMGTMTNTTMQVIQSNAEMMNASAPQQEPPSYKLARQAMVALSAIMAKTPATVLPDNEEQEQQALPPGQQPQQDEVPQKQKFSQLELLERSIMRHDSHEKVVARFLKALKSRKFVQFVQTNYGGNFVAMANARLGPWAAESDENMTYAQALIPALLAAGEKAGLVTAAAPKPPAVEAKAETLEDIAPSNGAHTDEVQAPVETPPEPSRRKKHVAPEA